jgi:putative membrane protein
VHHHHHYWWVFFVPIFWALFITAIVLLWRRGCGPRRGPTAKDILAERFARGEIEAEEYRDRLAQL